MCGIAGIISRQGIGQGELALMESMLQTQHHRGPDHSASTQLCTQVLFGHNRLSIIDLSEAANQPFYSEDQRYSIIYNGEIYNYVELKEELQAHYNFQTSSDTEVLLAA